VQAIYNNLMADLNLDPDHVPLLAGELLSEEINGRCFAFNQFIAQLPTVIPMHMLFPRQDAPDSQMACILP
jgi:hypothetical protein